MAIAGPCTLFIGGPAAAQTTGAIRPSIVITPGQQPAAPPAEEDQLLQLEVFINDQALNVIVPFTLHSDGTLTSSREVLEGIGVIVPPSIATSNVEVALA